MPKEYIPGVTKGLEEMMVRVGLVGFWGEREKKREREKEREREK